MKSSLCYHGFRFDSSVGKTLSWLLLLEGVLMLIPMFTGIAMQERDWVGFAAGAGACGVFGGVGTFFFRGSELKLMRRDAFLLISLVWILFSLISIIPFALAEKPLDIPSAFFESISGFTTTGATVICDVESQSHAILLWRAITQWIGGLGIVLFLIALMPALNHSGGIMMFNAEITGMTHDKLHPRIKQTAMSLWIVYISLTLVLTVVLMIEGMDGFDSICQSMATLSTGGFSTRNASIASWGSAAIAFTISLFMFAGGVNFILLYNLAKGKWREFIRNDIFRIYSVVVVASSVVISAVLFFNEAEVGFDSNVVAPFFHVTSAITSTGYSYSDFSLWGALPLFLTLLLMISGACAGSTTGAIKIDRISAVMKNIRKELLLTVYPHHVAKFKIGGKEVTDAMMLRVGGFVGIYFFLLASGAAVMAVFGYPLFDCIFASASCVGNNGLGFGVTASGFGELPDIVKWYFSLLMLVGRLEIFTVLALFIPSFWIKR